MKCVAFWVVCIAIHCNDAVVVHNELLRVSVNSTGPGRYGSPGCPCVGVDELDGETIATLKGGKKASYPADLGARCEAWDDDDHPSCAKGGKSWCKSKWCYVDPCNCKDIKVMPKPSNYLPGAKYHGRPVHFSYATCGGADSYTAEEEKKTAEDIAATCAIQVDSSKWGKEGCRCVGIGPQPGTTRVTIKGKQVDFPADTGASCHAWEIGNHPECTGGSAPSWCNQKWCYVDPCECGLETPPKTSTYLDRDTGSDDILNILDGSGQDRVRALYQGRPIYYSYATCGGIDYFTKSRGKEACVNIDNEKECKNHPKNWCAWEPKRQLCLGKELKTMCSGASSVKSMALLMVATLSALLLA